MSKLEMFAVRVDGDLKHALKLQAVKRRITIQELFEEIAMDYLKSCEELIEVKPWEIDFFGKDYVTKEEYKNYQNNTSFYKIGE